MDAQTLGIIGGIMGAVIGLGGGLLGAYMAIKNTQTPRERRFVIRVAVGFWLVVGVWMGGALVLVLADVLPLEMFWVLMLPFYIALGPFIQWGNRRQNAIRAADLHGESQPRE
jgi:Ca2+/Na+ antiporter